MVLSLFSSAVNITVSMTNKSSGLALEAVVKYKIFRVNYGKKQGAERPQLDKLIRQTVG